MRIAEIVTPTSDPDQQTRKRRAKIRRRSAEKLQPTALPRRPWEISRRRRALAKLAGEQAFADR